MLCAEYYRAVDFNLKTYQYYRSIYTKKLFRYDKYFEDSVLCEQNLYQNTALLLLSPQRNNIGQIVFCSKSIEDICGGTRASYNNTDISAIFTPGLQSFYKDLIRATLENENESLKSKVFRAYLLHRDKYIIEADIYLQIHPYINQNLYLDMIIRPVPSGQEYILLQENGDIEGATQAIYNTLGLYYTSKKTSTSIRVLAIERTLPSK